MTAETTAAPRENLTLVEHGLFPIRIHANLTPPQLLEHAVRRSEGVLTDCGAFTAITAPHTGRSAKDKFLVEEAGTRDRIWWEKNARMEPEAFERLQEDVRTYLDAREVFVQDVFAGADPAFRLPVRFITPNAWHALFVRNMFIRAMPAELAQFRPGFTVLHAPDLQADPARHGTRSGTFIVLNLAKRVVLIGGTRYAGEMKKSIFTALNYLLPGQRVFPMHCSANLGPSGDTAIFFGLSGTGKTTLSADPGRQLIGDDEHGWSDAGVFNFEGGCYAKTIDLSPEKEPQIWNAIRFGAVLENVAMDRRTRGVDFTDASITENTRVAYPLEFIEGAVSDGKGAHPKAVLFLTADAFGVLPPISALSPEQAAYYFLSGYTAKLAGTEADMETDVEATFSTCFGAPFLPLPATTYAEMLSTRLEEHGTRCYLINTGWSGGPYGVGNRINIAATREMVSAVIGGQLDDAQTRKDPFFGLNVPLEVPGVPTEVLDPRGTWESGEDYDEQAKKLAGLFRENFEKFESEVSEEVRDAGPRA